MQHFRRMEGSAVRRLRNLLAAAKTVRDNHLFLRCLSDRRKQHQFSDPLRYDSSISQSLPFRSKTALESRTTAVVGGLFPSALILHEICIHHDGGKEHEVWDANHTSYMGKVIVVILAREAL